MKSTAIVCAVLAGSLGFSGIASAQQWGGHRDHQQQQQQPVQVQQPREQHWQGQARTWNHEQPRYQHHEHRREYREPRYVYQQPRYVYQQPRHAYSGARFYRGGYLPRTYLNPGYYVDYRTYPGLYAPPYGYQWVNVDGEFMLVALATGLIANLLVNGY